MENMSLQDTRSEGSPQGSAFGWLLSKGHVKPQRRGGKQLQNEVYGVVWALRLFWQL